MLKSFQLDISQVIPQEIRNQQSSTNTDYIGIGNKSNKKRKILTNADHLKQTLGDYEKPLEICIPISSSLEKNPHQNSQLHNLLKVEFATRYLISINVDPSQSNIKRFIERMPPYTTFLRKGNNDNQFLVFRMTGSSTKKHFHKKSEINAHSKQLSNVNINNSQRKDQNIKQFGQVNSFYLNNLNSSSHRNQSSSINMNEDKNEWLYQVAKNAISSEKVSENSSTREYNDYFEKKEVVTQIEGFNSYSKRFLYPYNMLSQLPTQKNLSLVEKQVLALENNFSLSIFEMIHNQRKKLEKTKKKDFSSFDRSSFFENTLEKSNSPRSPLPSIREFGSKDSHENSTSQINLSTITSQIKSSRDNDSTSENLNSNTYLLNEPSSNLRDRFSKLFNNEKKLQSDMEVLLDKELEKPPYIENSEIRSMQEQFTRNFPFRMWKKKVPDITIQNLRKVLSSPTLTHFLKNFAIFSYWLFLGEFGLSSLKNKSIDDQFLNIYEEVLTILNFNKMQQSRQVIELPIIILCIRVCIESIFQTCYSNFWSSVFGKNLMKRLEILITFLLDPQSYFSNLALIQSSVEERKLSKILNKKSKIGKENTQGKQNFISPIVRFIIKEPSSQYAKKMFSNEYENENQQLVISQLMNHDHVRARLLSIIMSSRKDLTG